MSQYEYSRTLSVAVVSIALTACASASSTGQLYSAAGQYELAAQYYAHAFLQAPRSEQLKAEFQRTLDLSTRSLDAAYEAAEKAGTHRKAYALAIRKAELMQWAYKLRVEGINPASSVELVESSRAKATREAIALVDAAEQNGTQPKELLKLLREAIALDPDSSELNQRYTRLQKRLERHITLSIDCEPSIESICKAALSKLTEKLTEVRRELFSISTNKSDVSSAALVLKMNVKTQNGPWTPTRKGHVTSKINRLNDLQENAKDALGRQIFDHPKARYSTFKQTNKSTVHAAIHIRDLRGNQSFLYNGQVSKSEKNVSQYYAWSGDERAFTNHQAIVRLGTSHQPATSTDILTRRAWQKAIQDLANAIVAKLEN